MSKYRLINCEFLCSSSFKSNVSNKAKLLYFFMFMSGDDRGFVDTTNDIIVALQKNDNDFEKSENMSLLENTYETALNELLDRGYLYEFKDNHNNKVHLIRHWFYHNKWVKGLWTNYTNFLDLVHLEKNEYVLNSVKKPLKEENKEKEIKIEENKLNELIETFKDKEEAEITDDDFPFPANLNN